MYIIENIGGNIMEFNLYTVALVMGLLAVSVIACLVSYLLGHKAGVKDCKEVYVNHVKYLED